MPDPVSDRGERDVVVIGGGILGLALAIQAAQAGHRVTLLEGGDFGGGATANSLRIVHGGLRYLQTLDLRRSRRSIRARRELMRLAPEFTAPLECRIPLSMWGARSRMPMTLAGILADVLGWDRNVGIDRGRRLPGTKVFRKTMITSHGSSVPAAAWWDATVTRPHRLVAKLVRYCKVLGVRLLSYSRVLGLILDDENTRVIGVRYLGRGEDTPYELPCQLVLDAAGYGGRSFRRCIPGWRPLCDWLGAANILLDEHSPDSWATGLRAAEWTGARGDDARRGKQRDFFFVPTSVGVMAGTTYVAEVLEQGSCRLVRQALDQLLDEVNRARPGRVVSEANVRHVFWGLLPGTIGAPGSASERLLQRDLVVDGKKAFGILGYWRIQGVKLTTAFELASGALPQLYGEGAPDAGMHSLRPNARGDGELEAPIVLESGRTEGAGASIGDLSEPELRDLVSFCVRKEHARTLEDLLQRRLGFLPCDYPSEGIRRSLAVPLGDELGWSEQRLRQELDEADRLVEADPVTRACGSGTSANVGIG